MIDNKQACTLLKRSLVSYLWEILWRSVLFAVVLSAVDYFFRPKQFTFNDVEIKLVFFVILNSIVTLGALLLAAGRCRKRPNSGDET
jgi:hypothetical protein